MKKVLVMVLCVVMLLSFGISSLAISKVAVTGLSLDQSTISLGAGGTADLKIAFKPANTTQKLVTFATSNKNVASVNEKGQVKAVSAGKAVITVTSAANPKVSAKCTVEVMKPITLTMFAGDPNPNWNDMKDEVGKEITKRTGVTLKIDFAVGDKKQKVALLAASGQYPDFISAGFINTLVDAGALRDLTPLINKYAPNIKKVYGKYLQRQQWSISDKSVYVSANVDSIDNQVFDATGGFELQYAVLTEQNYPKIRTLAQYENAIKTYKAKHPTYNGKPTIGLSLIAEDWHSYISLRNPAWQSTGLPDNGEWYVDPSTYKATPHYFRPDEKEYFRWLNHMNATGLLDPETFTQKYDQYKAKIATGAVLGIIDQEWEYNDGEAALRTAGMKDRAYAHFPVTLNEKYKANDFNMAGFSGGDGTGISSSCKDPVRAIKFLDFLSSDEGQVLNWWGIKDVHYKVVNGKRVIPDAIQNEKTNNNTAFTKKNGLGNYRFSIRYGDGVKDPTGNYYTVNFPEQVVKAYPQEERDILKHYNATTWKDLFPKESEFKSRPYGAAWMISVPADSDLNVINTKMNDTCMKRIPEAVLTSPAKFDAAYDKFLAELKADGSDAAGKEFTSYVKDKILQWSKID